MRIEIKVAEVRIKRRFLVVVIDLSVDDLNVTHSQLEDIPI